MLAETYYKQEKFSSAIEYYQEFLKHNTHSLAAHVLYSVGWSYLNLPDYSKAVESFDKLVQKYPDSQFAEEGTYLLAKTHF